VYNAATLDMTSCTITGNTVGYSNGAGVYNAGPLDMTSCTITGNTAVCSDATSVPHERTVNLTCMCFMWWHGLGHVWR